MDNAMNYTIWKYPLQATDKQTIKLPIGSRLLCVKEQHDIPVAYFFVDPHEVQQETECTFYIFGTGHPVPNKRFGHYVDSVVCNKGNLVWHIFCDYNWKM